MASFDSVYQRSLHDPTRGPQHGIGDYVTTKVARAVELMTGAGR